MPGVGGQMQPSPLKKCMSVIPSSPQACGSEWVSQDDSGGRQNFLSTDHAPLSPQSSVASSGSEQTEEQGSSRNTFQEDGSGMKGQSSSSYWAMGLSWHLALAKASSCGGVNQNVTLPFFLPWCIFVIDVPAWLKSLRLHKYASLFSQMTYEEMMILTEQHLESQVFFKPPFDYFTLLISCNH